MKNERIIKIVAFLFVMLLFSMTRSYAVIEIKDSTSPVFTNKTISEFYDMTEEMKNPGQGLEGSTVDVKMANNYEWAAVSYFSNSSYGTGGAGQNTGVQLEDSTHLSTNGNITGVIDWGKTKTFTAGIMARFNDEVVTLTTDGGQSIINAAKNPNTTNRIDKFAGINQIDQSKAMTKWYGAQLWYNDKTTHPYSVREGLFGFWGGNGSNWATGKAQGDVTFRPVFYAQ